MDTSHKFRLFREHVENNLSKYCTAKNYLKVYTDTLLNRRAEKIMNIAIILSGGIGARMGGECPKQYIEIDGKPIISYCIDAFVNNGRIDKFIIVVADEWKDYVKHILKEIKQPVYYAQPGETRQFSIYNALVVAEGEGCACDDVVIIHDAVRPLVTDLIINQCIDGIDNYFDGVMPVIRVKDTIYQSRDQQTISCLLNRSELYAGQAPESFRLGRYLQIHRELSNDEISRINGSTEIAHKAGCKVKLIIGSELNFKITTPEDVINFEQIVLIRKNK